MVFVSVCLLKTVTRNRFMISFHVSVKYFYLTFSSFAFLSFWFYWVFKFNTSCMWQWKQHQMEQIVVMGYSYSVLKQLGYLFSILFHINGPVFQNFVKDFLFNSQKFGQFFHWIHFLSSFAKFESSGVLYSFFSVPKYCPKRGSVLFNSANYFSSFS